MVTGCIFDIRVFNPFVPSNWPSLQSTYEKHKREKCRACEEHGSFTPLVFSASDDMGPTAQVVYSLLAAKLAEKRGDP